MNVPPPMNFDAGTLFDQERMRNGPLEVFWGQETWIHPTKPLPPAPYKWPRRKWWQFLYRSRRWYILMRLAPPEDYDLDQWGKEIGKRLGVEWRGEVEPQDRAVWIPMTAWARTAPNCLASAGLVLTRLQGFTLRQAQVRVWRADA